LTLISYIDSFGTTHGPLVQLMALRVVQMYNSNKPIMKITLKEKKLADGRIGLYIESFKGSTVDEKTGGKECF
jgi:hypothetical protein